MSLKRINAERQESAADAIDGPDIDAVIIAHTHRRPFRTG